MVTKITDHAARALARLTQALKGKPKLAKLVTALAGEAQAVEDMLYDLLTKRLLSAEGAQLDAVGKVVGERREGADDALFLSRILMRIRANRSRGTTEDLYAVVRAALVGGRVTALRGDASVQVTVTGVAVSAALGALFLRYLQIAKSAGVRLALVFFSGADDANAFAFGRYTFTIDPIAPTDTQIFVASTEGFPNVGDLIADDGVEWGGGTQDVANYIGKTPSSFILGDVTFSAAHGIGASIRLATGVVALGHDTTDGKGFTEKRTFVRIATVAGATSLPTREVPIATPCSLIIDQGTALEETVAASAKTTIPPSYTVAALAHDHDVGATVILATDTTGGEFASAIGD